MKPGAVLIPFPAGTNYANLLQTPKPWALFPGSGKIYQVFHENTQDLLGDKRVYPVRSTDNGASWTSFPDPSKIAQQQVSLAAAVLGSKLYFFRVDSMLNPVISVFDTGTDTWDADLAPPDFSGTTPNGINKFDLDIKHIELALLSDGTILVYHQFKTDTSPTTFALHAYLTHGASGSWTSVELPGQTGLEDHYFPRGIYVASDDRAHLIYGIAPLQSPDTATVGRLYSVTWTASGGFGSVQTITTSHNPNSGVGYGGFLSSGELAVPVPLLVGGNARNGPNPYVARAVNIANPAWTLDLITTTQPVVGYGGQSTAFEYSNEVSYRHGNPMAIVGDTVLWMSVGDGVILGNIGGIYTIPATDPFGTATAIGVAASDRTGGSWTAPRVFSDWTDDFFGPDGRAPIGMGPGTALASGRKALTLGVFTAASAILDKEWWFTVEGVAAILGPSQIMLAGKRGGLLR